MYGQQGLYVYSVKENFKTPVNKYCIDSVSGFV